MAELTPLMRQYTEIKSQHPDKIVLFRMGDFYEMFHEDAEMAAPLLNIQLTCRNKKAKDETKMCGVPHHSIAGPIAKLLSHGLKVAMAEQVEDPKLAKGLVKRAVTRVLTPGVVYDPDTLDQLNANYIACFDDESVSFADVSTGEAFYYVIRRAEDRTRLLELLQPSEILVYHPKWRIERSTLVRFNPTQDGVQNRNIPATACCVIHYVSGLQADSTSESRLGTFERRHLDQVMRLSSTTLAALEVFENSTGGKDGTLFESFRKFKTPMGARLFRSWLRFPLLDQKQLQGRHDEIDRWQKNVPRLQQVRDLLSELGDVERRLAQVLGPSCHLRHISSLQAAVRVGLGVTGQSEAATLRQLSEWLDTALENDQFKTGFDPRLDELRSLSYGAEDKLQQFETRERGTTGISSLKVRSNAVFGFYIEITHTHRDRVPDHYIRKQTLTNAERFTTPELQELEGQVLGAQTRQSELERELLQMIRSKIIEQQPEILHWSRRWAEMDVLSTLAWIALERKYVRPRFVTGSLSLSQSRHPMLELNRKSSFTPNSVRMRSGDCLLLTGPNMAGKSTLMRQTALILLLAQAGSFVPAEQAEIPIVDGIYTRIGASDALHQGLSTFMLEMTETAEILKFATERSFVLLDEIGRGTSTYDGMSLAQAILEYMVDQCRPFLLFATHYHELTQCFQSQQRIRNVHMSILEKGDSIQFLYTLREGAAEKSYGIHVAKLAGIPNVITRRAAALLKSHEQLQDGPQMSLWGHTEEKSSQFVESNLDRLKARLKELDLNQLTPVQAMVELQRIKQDMTDI